MSTASLYALPRTAKSDGKAVSSTVARANRFFLTCLAILVVFVQLLLLSPLAQQQWPVRGQASEISPPVHFRDYSEYNATYGCVATLGKSDCSIEVGYDFQAPTDLTEPSGILVADYSGAVLVELNGQPINSRRPVPQVQRLMFSIPDFVVFPPDILKPGANSVVVHVTSDLPLGGLLQKVLIGRAKPLEEIFSSTFRAKWTIPRLVEGVLLFACLFSGYAALRHLQTVFLSIFILSTCYCFGTFVNLAAADSTDVYSYVPIVGRLTSAIFVVAVMTASAHKVSLISIKYLFLFPVALVAMVIQCGSGFERLFVVQCFWIFSLIVSSVGIAYAARTLIERRDYFEIPVIILAAAAIVMNVFNLMASFGHPHPIFIALRGYTALFLVLIIAIKIFRSYSSNLVRANSANEILADEVAQVTQKLSLFYFKENALKHEMSVQVERERLMGDLHDGLAGNLISINALAEYGTNEVLDDIRGLSKLALLDLRLVVDSLDSFDGELAVALAAFRERMVPQYSGSAVNIIWDYDYAPMLQDLRPEVNLAMFRILQESISNAVRHGKATQIQVIVRPSKAVGSSASIWVLDNGDASGFFAPGFGMRNMQRRAERIHGKVYFRLRGNGSAVLLKIK